MAKVAAEEGPSALMKGVVPRCLYLGPLAAITLTIYEKVMPACMRRYSASALLSCPVSLARRLSRGRVCQCQSDSILNDNATVRTGGQVHHFEQGAQLVQAQVKALRL